METLLVVVVFVALLLLFGVAWQAVAGRSDFRQHPPPGRLVDLGSHRLHILAMGEGSPAVVMDSGLPGSVLSWWRVQPEIAKFTCAVSYDRAGLGWSDAGPLPRTAERIARELHALLERAAVAPPYVLVGHSFGGLTMRLFAARYPKEIAGVVLVDPIGPREWLFPTEKQKRELRGGARLCRRGAWLARLGVARWIALLVRLGALGAVRFAVGFVSSGALRETASTISPLEKLPHELRSIVPLFWLQPRFYQVLASQIESLRESAEQVAAAGASGSWPMVVLSSGRTEPRRRSEQEALAKSLPRGRHAVVAAAGHWIQLDEPEAIAAAIREVVQAARAAAPRQPR
jgi:pimeloyl-ACP methyl ester carboxylesterase